MDTEVTRKKRGRLRKFAAASRPALSTSFLSDLDKFYRKMEEEEVNSEEMRGIFRDLCLRGYAERGSSEVWGQCIELIQRAILNSGKYFDEFLNFILENVTVTMDCDEKVKEVYEVMMVASCGKGLVPCQVMNQYAWCLYEMEKYGHAEDMLVDIKNEKQFLAVSFGGLYHTALLLEKKGRPRAARVWEQFLIDKASDVKEDQNVTLDMVKEIAGNIIDFPERGCDPSVDVGRLYDLVLGVYQGRRAQHKFRFYLKRAAEDREARLNSLKR